MALPAVLLAFGLVALGALTMLTQGFAIAGRTTLGLSFDFEEADRVMKARLLRNIRNSVKGSIVNGQLPAGVPSTGNLLDDENGNPIQACAYDPDSNAGAGTTTQTGTCAAVLYIVYDNAAQSSTPFPAELNENDNADSWEGSQPGTPSVAQQMSAEYGLPSPGASPVPVAPRFHVHLVLGIAPPIDGASRTRHETLNFRIYNRAPYADLVGEETDKFDPATAGVAGDVTGQTSQQVDTSAHAWLSCPPPGCNGQPADETTTWQQQTGTAVGPPAYQWGS